MRRAVKRSYKLITTADLSHLSHLALEEIDSFFRRRKDLRHFQRRLVAIALCQGAALHYVDKRNGVKDFDVFFFFGGGYDPRLVNRRAVNRESDLLKFGVHPDDAERGFTTRRIDFFRRFIGVSFAKTSGNNPECILRNYLNAGRTDTARYLAEKAVVGLWPDTIFAKVLWRRHGEQK